MLMSELVGRLNRTIAARGPDSLWVESRDALMAAYQTIGDLHDEIDRLQHRAVHAEAKEAEYWRKLIVARTQQSSGSEVNATSDGEASVGRLGRDTSEGIGAGSPDADTAASLPVDPVPVVLDTKEANTDEK